MGRQVLQSDNHIAEGLGCAAGQTLHRPILRGNTAGPSFYQNTQYASFLMRFYKYSLGVLDGQYVGERSSKSSSVQSFGRA